ncbi:MAG TPA: VCBS repeat-containing protein [Planctomycetota bacterium]
MALIFAPALAASLAAPAGAQAFQLLERKHTDAWSMHPDQGILRDADGNGTIDVLLRSGSLLLNDGQLGFPWYPPGTRIPWQVVPGFPLVTPQTFELAGDVDRDGNIDLVRVRNSLIPPSSEIAVNYGQPGGFWGPMLAASPPHATFNSQAVAMADFDGDQYPDLLVFRGSAQQLTQYRNQQNGQFVEFAALPAAAVWERTAVGDVDGDGDVDVICRPSGQLQVLANTGAGGFANVGPSGLTATPDLQGLHLADADADGDLDLLGVPASASPLQLWLNNGAGVFAPGPWQMPIAGGGCAFADLDHDSRADLLLIEVPGAASLVMRCLRNTTAGFVQASTTSIDEWEMLGNPAIADLDGDGDDDAVLAGTLLLLHDGALGFHVLRKLPFERTANASTVFAADLDGDDLPEVIAGDSVHQNGGDGWFDLGGSPVPAGAAVRAIADLDLDGDVDAVWTRSTAGAGNWGILRNQGGTLVAQTMAGAPASGRVVVADFDGDVFPDLATQTGTLLRNTAGAGFAAIGALPVGSSPFAAGDFDNDGDPDLVVSDGSTWRIYANSAFSFQPAGTPQPDGLQCAIARDLDGDGDTDLAALCFPPSQSTELRVWTNQGGVLQLVTSRPDGRSTNAIAADDFDGDGDVDIATGWVWENLGGWSFGNLGQESSGHDPCLVDIDGDGDVDLVRGSSPAVPSASQRPQLHANMIRHLSAARLPVLGQPYAIHMSSRGASIGGDFVVPALATTRIAPFALPGLGLLHLDPTTTVLGPIGTTDPNGQCVFAFTLPATQALGGVEVYWQGLVLTASDLRLTNLLRDLLLP